MNKEDLVKEVATINLGENGFLLIKCGEDVDVAQMEAFRKSFDTFMDGKFKDRVLIYSGDLDFKKITKNTDVPRSAYVIETVPMDTPDPQMLKKGE